VGCNSHLVVPVRDEHIAHPLGWGRRIAALFQGLRCSWPGCGRSTRIHIDHLDEWQNHGCTDQVNAGPECLPHNLIKTQGYRVMRDELGRWHTYRPDGSEIAPI